MYKRREREVVRLQVWGWAAAIPNAAREFSHQGSGAGASTPGWFIGSEQNNKQLTGHGKSHIFIRIAKEQLFAS